MAPNVKLAAAFPNKIFLADASWNFGQLPDVSLTALKFTDIFRFSRQVITLNTMKETRSLMLAKTHLTFSSKSCNILLRAAVISSATNSHSFVLTAHQSLNSLLSHTCKSTFNFNNNLSFTAVVVVAVTKHQCSTANPQNKSVNILLMRIKQTYTVVKDAEVYYKFISSVALFCF